MVDQASTRRCVSCGADIDIVDGRAPRRCPVCVSGRNRWLVAGALVAVVGVAVALVVTQVDLSKPKTADSGSGSAGLVVPPTPEETDVDKAPSAMETAAIEKCDQERILNIAKTYSQDDKWHAVVRASEAFQKKCEHSHLLDWKLFYALEQLKRWKEAAAVATTMIVHEPNDTDFWWWRGKARSFSGEHEGAIVDLRQSLADADADSNGVQIGHLQRAATAVKQGCEHAFSLRWLSTVGVELRSSSEREFHQSYLANECEKLDGRGTFKWKTADLSRGKLKGTVGGTAVQFMLERTLGTTLVTTAFADKLSLPRGTEVEVMLPTGLGKGVTSSADVVVGAARATAVPLVIVEKLPEGYDAVLGLSFLWRFKVEPTDDGYVAKPPVHDIGASEDDDE